MSRAQIRRSVKDSFKFKISSDILLILDDEIFANSIVVESTVNY